MVYFQMDSKPVLSLLVKLDSEPSSSSSLCPPPLATESADTETPADRMLLTDVVDGILRNGAHRLTIGQKIELAKHRPTPPLTLNALDGTTVRKFQFNYYSKYPWLTGSPARSELYCYCCLLLSGDRKWGSRGVPMSKNFLRIANKHAVSERHLACHEKFKLLGKTGIDRAALSSSAAALRHNERVGVYRRALSRLVRAVCRLGRRDECDRLEPFDPLSEEERLLGQHFTSMFRGTTCDGGVQNDMVACVEDVMNARISNELSRAKFVSVQVDETADVSCVAQMSVVFRYVIDSNVEERFVGFFDLPRDRTAADVSRVLLKVISKWNVSDKLVCQTYDGAIAMAGRRDGGVPALVKSSLPNVAFAPCHAHHLNLVVLHGLKTIKSVRSFVGDLAMFRSFFSGSPKRSRLLREKGFEVSDRTRWNYHSGAVATIVARFAEIRKTVTLVLADDDDWDPTSVGLAGVLSAKLSDFKFLFLLRLFGEIFVLFDHVISALRTIVHAAGVQNCVNKTAELSRRLAAMKDEAFVLKCYESAVELSGKLEYSEYSKEDVENVGELTNEILDSLILQTEVRFRDLIFLQFIEISDHGAFEHYKNNFPDDKLLELHTRFPGVFDPVRLTNELTLVFNSTDKRLSAKDLLNYIYVADLQEVYQELTKLLQLILCIPITPASCEGSTSVIKRIKTFLMNSMNNDQLSNLCTLAIESKMLGELMIDPTFIDRVIDLFSMTKNRTINLTYKVI